MAEFLHIEDVIERLALSPHPEGGWFRETYRSAVSVPSSTGAARSVCTAIYYLLGPGGRSNLHRICSDEIWHFHAGAPLVIHIITPSGEYLTRRLGPPDEAGEYQVVIPARCWFGALADGNGPFSLVGCTVSPGFSFDDFELGIRRELLALFPQHGDIINRLTAAEPR